MNIRPALAAALAASAGLAHGQSTSGGPAPGSASSASQARPTSSATPEQLAQLNDAVRLIQQGRPRDAITQDLDPVIAALEAKFNAQDTHYFCAQTSTELLYYMTKAAVDKKSAIGLDGTWANAYFTRGYAYVELGDLARAEQSYQRAAELAPANAHVLSELADLHSRRKDWPGALALFQSALDQAPQFAPPASKNAEMGRALRGIGYVDVELGKLDDAEAAYRRCLEIDPHNQKAINELGYVQGLRKKANAG